MLTVDRGSRHKEKNINDNVGTNCLILIYHNYYIFDDTTKLNTTSSNHST